MAQPRTLDFKQYYTQWSTWAWSSCVEKLIMKRIGWNMSERT